jgi:hypothetical protein
LISALRTPPRNPERPSGEAGPAQHGQQGPAPAAVALLDTRAAFGPLALGAGTCLLAGTLVAVVGATTMGLGQLPVVLLIMGTAAVAAPALWVSGRLLWRGVGQGRPDLALYAGAGLALTFAAIAATLIAGSG